MVAMVLNEDQLLPIGVLPVLAYAEEHSLFLGENDAGQLHLLVATAHPLLGERICISTCIAISDVAIGSAMTEA